MAIEYVEAAGFPLATAAATLAASFYAYTAYRNSGSTAALALSAGLFAVFIQAVLESVINVMVLRSPAFYGSSTHYALDAVRGIAIVFWSAAMASVLIETIGVESRWIRLGLPGIVFVSGTVYTLAVNLLSGIEPPSHRLLVSSIGRVLGQLVPLALLAGAYFTRELALPTGSRAAMLIGLAFIMHGFTLPLYSVAKSLGMVTLGLWYAVGGIMPALLAAYGFRLLTEEQREAVAG
ncbi:hypothetical protein [Aeropyrum camini]|uniref:Uncharacterized protein n=1 Tax=Aeropyrum camini SY1 = JCM 12091 TaxID=1198449 RepID=U3TE61_9CREN|nr:hypothetical protein [Aeropyrum camini]BAN90325.1 hypothetical protein ACAM_0856 [Aeropyrum camini SY1 = JCM 12091]